MSVLLAFNPHDLPEKTVYAIATGREDNLDFIINEVRENLRSKTRQHLIVSGPRGYGKSFLMRHLQLLLEHIAKDEDLAIGVVIMPEEMPHVREPETLLRELTRTFLGVEGGEALLSWHDDEDDAWGEAALELETAITNKLSEGGLLVALVENFDQLLRRAFDKGDKTGRLREFLTRNDGRLMLVAASATGAFDRDYDRPLYRAFKEVTLRPWSLEETIDFFNRQRQAVGLPPLDGVKLARAKAVAHFIGGTPRLATLLGEALLGDDVIKAADLLNRLVDELTPYYKERIDSLPGRSQKLLDALLRFGEPATQSDLAKRVKANAQPAIAGPFKTLMDERIVVGEKAHGSAEILYRVADRVFAHYYRRRIVAHGSETCALEALVDLLAQFFTPEELKQKAEEFSQKGLMAEAELMRRLSGVGGETLNAMHYWIVLDFKNYYVPKRLLPHASAAIGQLLTQSADLALKGKVEAAKQMLLDEAQKTPLPPDHILLYLALSRLEVYSAGEDHQGQMSAEAMRLCKQYDLDASALGVEAHLVCAWQLYFLPSHKKEALEAAQKADELALGFGTKSQQSMARRYTAYSLSVLGRHKEAVETAREAAQLAVEIGDKSEQAEALGQVAFSLGQLSRHEEAVEVARKAAQLAAEIGDKREQAWALNHLSYSALELTPKPYWPILELKTIAELLDQLNDDNLKSEFGNRIINLSACLAQHDLEAWDSVFAALSTQWTDHPSTDQWLGKFIKAFISGLIRNISDPKTLTDAHDLIRLYFAERFARDMHQLKDAATYHQSGRDKDVLVRMEPDYAQTLQIIFPPKKPTKAKTDKKSPQRKK